MREGDRSPWGKIQHVQTLGEGAWFVSTAGHGGIKLDRKRNAAIPSGARMAGGWYEEDCKCAIALYIHADIRAASTKPDAIVATIKAWESPRVQEALGVT